MRTPTAHELMLMSVADVLGEKLLDLVTFVGGATVSLHLDDAQPIDIRSTKDVDFIVSVTSYPGYQELSQKLREVGFKEYIPEDNETPLCRFVCDGILVDVMPDDEGRSGKMDGTSLVGNVDGGGVTFNEEDERGWREPGRCEHEMMHDDVER